MHKKLLMFDKKQSSLRLRSELNDLKRTSESVAKELNYKESEIKKYLSGKYNINSYLNFLIKFCDFYPVNMSTLIIYKKDTKNGILFSKLADSLKVLEYLKEKTKIINLSRIMNTETRQNQIFQIFIQNGFHKKDM